MAVQVRIPTMLRANTDGAASVPAEGSSVGEVLADLVRRFPGLEPQLLDGTQLHRFVNVYVNDEDIRYLEALDTKVAEGDVVSIVPAVAGG